MRHLFLFSVFCVLLSGCTTTLHLTTSGYSETQQAELAASLKSALKAHDVNVVHTRVLVPKQFDDASVALNPGFDGASLIQDLDLWLQRQGHKASTEYRFAEGNHFYRQGHVGLYLRNPDASSHYAMPEYLRTQYCKAADGTLAFMPNKQLVLEYEMNGDSDDTLLREEGTWQLNGTVLTLTLKRQDYAFTLTKEKRSTPYGMKPADVFKPRSDHSDKPVLGCDFLIIYI